jgi:CrcB protein
MNYIWIGLGSALGGMARYWCTGVIPKLAGTSFPWGTLAVNVIGSGFIGFFATLTSPEGRLLVGTLPRQFVMVGICGGFTTFSTLSLETLNLARDGEWLRAGVNAAGSVVCCLLAVWMGSGLASSLNR